jgi:hypothetical protein
MAEESEKGFAAGGAEKSAVAGVENTQACDWSIGAIMVEETKTEKISLEQLMVSTLAAADATVKLLIAKGVFTDEEFKAQLSTERANYIAVLNQLH